MEALAIPFLLAVGALLALQAAANVQLSAALGSPFTASTQVRGKPTRRERPLPRTE